MNPDLNKEELEIIARVIGDYSAALNKFLDDYEDHDQAEHWREQRDICDRAVDKIEGVLGADG